MSQDMKHIRRIGILTLVLCLGNALQLMSALAEEQVENGTPHHMVAEYIHAIIEADRTRTVYNWLQYFSPGSLEMEFAACGLKVDGLYSDVAGSPFNPESQEFAAAAHKV